MPNMNDPQQQQMMQQQMMQMQQQMMQQRGGDPNAQQANRKQRPTDIYLVANQRQNSVIVHAPPNKMAIVEAFFKRIDVPGNTQENVNSMLTNVKVYRLASLDPDQLVTSLLAMDALEPSTRLEVDKKNKAVIAYASLPDQFTIAKIIERLDGSAREFEVIQLRRLDAEEVAGTVRFLMGVEQEEEKEDNNLDYYFYGYRNRNQQNDDAKKDTFRVGANSRDNQLLVWANEKEREEIHKLLVKLGEIPPEGGFASKVRVIDANRSAETLEYLKRLQERWGQISEAPLILPTETEFQGKTPSDDSLSPEIARKKKRQIKTMAKQSLSQRPQLKTRTKSPLYPIINPRWLQLPMARPRTLATGQASLLKRQILQHWQSSRTQLIQTSLPQSRFSLTITGIWYFAAMIPRHLMYSKNLC